MKILAIDTSTGAGSAAVVEDGLLRAQSYLHNKLTHSQTIMSMVDDVLKGAELTPSDIDYFAVSVGPGSFTGLRIGVATAKGLAHAVGKKVIGVNTLEAIGAGMAYCDYPVVPILDARRGQVYTAIYKGEECTLQPCAVTIEECISECKKLGTVVFAGDGVMVHRECIKEHMGEAAMFAPPYALMQRASVIASMAEKRIASATEPHMVIPFYMRKSQAEREAEEKER